MSHPWFKNLSWKKLENKELLSPYLPNVDIHYDGRLKTVTLIRDSCNRQNLKMNNMNRIDSY